MSELRADLLEEQEEQEEVAILDDTSAEMMLARIKEADEQYERMAAWYDFQKEKAKTIRDRTRAWAEGCLRHYFDMVPTHDTKTRRTYDLPSGTLTLAKQEPEYEQNDAELIPWLKANRPELIKIKETANWKDLKKELKISSDGTGMITEDGEIVPGVTVTMRDDKFTAKTK